MEVDLQNLVRRTRGGVFNVCALDPQTNRLLASGSGFWCRGYFITNHHVMNVPAGTNIWLRREGDADPLNSGTVFTYSDWLSRIVTTSDEHSYDYAIMDCPELSNLAAIHSFELIDPETLSIGAPIALMGYPLEHQNFTIHSGIISSFYKKRTTRIVQVDASVNSGNSGGPLLDPLTGSVIGLVSRKATGLSAAFDQLRSVLGKNAAALQGQGGIFMNGIDSFKILSESYRSTLDLTYEIERQANVGIGYAMSAKHLLDEGCLQTSV
ncbi:MAG: serine protease [Pseudorhizobium pelagicum]|uniref:S1 family peptidase n=1 Tax=Pseudorhizobium pelagicum TaxID=1509405 RepID=UPI00346066DB